MGGWSNTNTSSGGGGSVDSVTGLNTNNLDPANPVVNISVDGTTITGRGTPASPLQANFPTTKYGSFRSQSTQVVIVATENPISTEYTDESVGVSVNPLSGNIEFTTVGIYMVEATILFRHNSPLSADSGYVWIQKDGVNVAESTRSIRLNQNINITTLTLSYMVNIASVSDTLRLYFTTTSTDVEIYYDSTVSGIPNSSSVIINVFQIA